MANKNSSGVAVAGNALELLDRDIAIARAHLDALQLARAYMTGAAITRSQTTIAPVDTSEAERTRTGKGAGQNGSTSKPASGKPSGGTMTPAKRKQQAERMKQYWADRKAKEAAAKADQQPQEATQAAEPTAKQEAEAEEFAAPSGPHPATQDEQPQPQQRRQRGGKK